MGLPNVGKSTLFNALTKNNVLAANYPFAVAVINPSFQLFADLLKVSLRVYFKDNFKEQNMTIIGLKELRQNAGMIAERVAKGERFTVVKRSKPVFEITPLSRQGSSDQELKEWTKQAIKRYRPALKALSEE